MEDQQQNIEPGKIFVGGLSWDTTKESLQHYFSKYGEVSDCVVMKDGDKPRGFGFVTFAEPASVQAVLTDGPHDIDNKKVETRQATIRSKGGVPMPEPPIKKVFIGGLSFDTEESDLKMFFEKYGKVTNVDIKKERDTQKKRGFAFLDFESEDSVDAVCAKHFFTIDGKTVEVKKAEPRKAQDMTRTQPQGMYLAQNSHQSYPHQSFGFQSGLGRGGAFNNSSQYAGNYGYPYQYDYTSGYSSGTSGGYPGAYNYATYGRGYTGQQQLGQYPQDSGYGGQSRSAYAGSTDTYSTGTPTYGYEHTQTPSYNYTEQSGGGTYGRGGGQQRSGFPYQSR